ncbi:sulfotransferase, partial [Klebsiella variicola]|uniref:sulfotransferase n=1 Tax=Klebsiella variicola TaxID=244366 RepID=UPI0027312E2D
NYRMKLSGEEAELGFPAALHAVYGNKPRWKWGDKWPDYVFHMREIKAHFPNAKVIYIYRDGRDVVASMLRKQIADDVNDG